MEAALRRIAALLVVGLLCAGLVGGWAGPAQAAPRLESSTPADGGAIPAGGPVEIVLRFSEPLRDQGATLVLLDDGGHRRRAADVQIEGETLHGLLPEVPPGDYRASYRATGESGDDVHGELPFSISAPQVSLLGADLPSWTPTALIVLFVGIAALAVVAIAGVGTRRDQ